MRLEAPVLIKESRNEALPKTPIEPDINEKVKIKVGLEYNIV